MWWATAIIGGIGVAVLWGIVAVSIWEYYRSDPP